MPRFSYVAQDANKNILSGEVEAQDRETALKILTTRGLELLKLGIAGQERKKSWLSSLLKLQLSGGGINMMDRITIIRHLGTILNTGTDLLSALDMIAQDAIKPNVQKILYDIKEKISLGEKFSEALKPWKYEFTPILVNLVMAGENSGNLPNILLSYAQELRKDNSFNRKLKSAMVYPIILIAALLIMLIVILTVVTPKLKDLFASTNANPPIYTRIFFGMSDILLIHWFTIIIGTIILVISLIIALRNKKFKSQITELLWGMPILKKVRRNLMLTRLVETLSHLLKAGFSMKSALSVSGEIVSPKYQEILKEITVELEKGIGIGESFGKFPDFFPKILVSVVRTGEKSGQLSAVFDQMGEFYEEEVLYSLELFLTLIEPILLVIVGLIVGLMAGSLIAPLYKLIGSIR